MECTFKRINKNSKLMFINEIGVINTSEQLKKIEENYTILQTGVVLDTLLIVEYISIENASTVVDSSGDIELENALDTILNKDPFGAKYSGKPLRTIFDAHDKEWIDKALTLMHNQFIVDKIKLIMGKGYGKN